MTAPIDEARLRELAEAATGGKWGAWVKSGVIQIDNRGGDGKNPAIVNWRGFDGNDLPLKANKANAAFIAAANPATIRALLDALSAERERGDRAVEAVRARRNLYAWKRDQRDAFSPDTRTEWEVFNTLVEGFDILETEILATQKAEGA